MRVETFHTGGAPALALRLPSGSVEVETVDGDETRVELEGLNDAGREAVEEALVEHSGDEVRVEVLREKTIILAFRAPRIRLRVTCPHGTRLRAEIVAADLRARGSLGASDVKTVSGDVELPDVGGDLTLKTVSGDLVAGRVDGALSVNTVSGDVRVGAVASSVSGKTISGDLAVRSVSSGTVGLQSVSGDLRVGIASGIGVWMDLKSVSGDTRSDLAPADGPGESEASTVEVRAKSVSGDIHLARA